MAIITKRFLLAMVFFSLVVYGVILNVGYISALTEEAGIINDQTLATTTENILLGDPSGDPSAFSATSTNETSAIATTTTSTTAISLISEIANVVIDQLEGVTSTASQASTSTVLTVENLIASSTADVSSSTVATSSLAGGQSLIEVDNSNSSSSSPLADVAALENTPLVINELIVLEPAALISSNTASSSANSPIIAAWALLPNFDGVNQADDSLDLGAQFSPSGKFEENKIIKVCALVSDSSGVANIDNVQADIFYPQDIALGPNHPVNRQGCGQQLGEEAGLTKLTKTAGEEIFCHKIRNDHNNLPIWNSLDNYDEVCAPNGGLDREITAVYCGEVTLSYDDPAGEYRVLVKSQNKNGLNGALETIFTYLDLTAFEADFTNLYYGAVKLNLSQIIYGDLVWGDWPSVRNIGNTRLSIKVEQDDMGLGQTDGFWNVRYEGRLGDSAAYKSYWPGVVTILDNSLNLSELNEMDFSINVSQFPPIQEDNNDFGRMVLSAEKAPHLTCQAE